MFLKQAPSSVAGKSEDGLVLGSGGEEQSVEKGFNTKFQE